MFILPNIYFTEFYSIMRGTKVFLDQNDNIEINSFGLQHDCNCLYIEHILCFNIHTYKLIRL